MNKAQERSYIEDVIESIDKHIGRRVIGSLTPATPTRSGIPLLAGMISPTSGSLPRRPTVPVNVPKGKMISVPYRRTERLHSLQRPA